MSRNESIESIRVHEGDYKGQAWEAYTFAELGHWVHLLATRATHRVPGEKRAKDLYDAGNYLAMMTAKLEALKASLAEPASPDPACWPSLGLVPVSGERKEPQTT